MAWQIALLRAYVYYLQGNANQKPDLNFFAKQKQPSSSAVPPYRFQSFFYTNPDQIFKNIVKHALDYWPAQALSYYIKLLTVLLYLGPTKPWLFLFLFVTVESNRHYLYNVLVFYTKLRASTNIVKWEMGNICTDFLICVPLNKNIAPFKLKYKYNISLLWS